MATPNRRIALVALAALALTGGSASAAPATGDMTLGDPKAKVKMVEYASLSCSHCAAFNNDVFPEFRKKYIDTGKVHYTLREILTAPHEVAAAGFLTARCAGKDKYFTVVDTMFREFPAWSSTGRALDSVIKAGAAGGLSEDQVKACITDQASMDALHARVNKAAEEGGINGTPTFFFNGQKVREGEMSAADLEAAVAAASKR